MREHPRFCETRGKLDLNSFCRAFTFLLTAFRWIYFPNERYNGMQLISHVEIDSDTRKEFSITAKFIYFIFRVFILLGHRIPNLFLTRLSNDDSWVIVLDRIRACRISCWTVVKLHTYRCDPPSMQLCCTYAAVNVARVCTVALDHGIRVRGCLRAGSERRGSMRVNWSSVKVKPLSRVIALSSIIGRIPWSVLREPVRHEVYWIDSGWIDKMTILIPALIAKWWYD